MQIFQQVKTIECLLNLSKFYKCKSYIFVQMSVFNILLLLVVGCRFHHWQRRAQYHKVKEPGQYSTKGVKKKTFQGNNIECGYYSILVATFLSYYRA